MERNWYLALGLTTAASDIEIKRAFRKLAQIYHPDKTNNPIYFEQFKQIKKAYEILGTPDSRRIYDNSLQLQTQYYGVQHPINNIEDLVIYFHKVERELKQIDCRFTNHNRIQWQLNGIFFLPQTDEIIQSGNFQVQQKLLKQVLYILSFLPYKKIQPYQQKLSCCFYEQNHTNDIRQLLADKKREEQWEKFKIPIVALLSALLCIAIYFLSK